MRQRTSIDSSKTGEKKSADTSRAPSGSQTLLRGLDVLEGVAEGPISLGELAAHLGLTRSTTHRLANALTERRYLTFVPGRGYQLGPKLLELGFQAQQQADLVQIAHPWLEVLAQQSEDTVHLGVRDGDSALYLDKIPGRRRIVISSRVGDRHPLTSTGLGKALLLDEEPSRWQELFELEKRKVKPSVDYKTWLKRMTGYVDAGRTFDLEENEDQIRCVAAPIRDASGRILGAISVSSAAQYMDDDRMAALSQEVVGTANSISRELGWNPEKQAQAARGRPKR
ncbi:IclR family transcriptional regulator [Pedomonas mirosovicensis]|uniref:IclR family transcriptional regulator n=1 Tax=Pedomonas mirosovicensis TaxID=2908641 RepID=UPI002168D745|nr:IclR family transcriptional regulator [Pedomonas mirosovicensis]MCH8686191.1 IclR family transcriptional regulator [Pedomonas mirosovicensis]